MGRRFAPVGQHVQLFAVVELRSAMEGGIKKTGKGNAESLASGKRFPRWGAKLDRIQWGTRINLTFTVT